MAGSTVPVACTPVIRRITVIRTAYSNSSTYATASGAAAAASLHDHTYHMRCPENGDTQRQAVEPGKPLCCVRAGMQIFTRASASNSTFLFHGGPSPRRSTRPPSLAPPASSPPGGGGETGLAAPSRVRKLLHGRGRRRWSSNFRFPVRGSTNTTACEVRVCALEWMCTSFG